MDLLHSLYVRFFRLFFYLLYQPFAWMYDFVAAFVSLGRWNDWVQAIIPYLSGPKILELGHGPGHLQAALYRSGFDAVGLDRSAQMGRVAQRQLNKNEPGILKERKLKLVRANGMCLPFADQSFDQIAATFPTEYMTAEQTLSEIRRVLKPSGQLIVLPAAWITGKSFPERALALLFRITGQAPAEGTDFDHLLEPVRNMGFDIRLEWVHQVGSRLLIVIASPKDYSNSI